MNKKFCRKRRIKHLRFVLIIALMTSVEKFSIAGELKMIPWDMKSLSAPPKMFNDLEHSIKDVNAIFYEGLSWKGKPTRVFAYYGLPKIEHGKKVPAMVLVHGGGGSAFIPWVRLWNNRGYAAIAMDTCGCVSGGEYNNHPRHEYGGPPGWGGFDQIDEPIKDQWTYHAVADVILAHSLIRSFPQVDTQKIGITGISWGGYLTCIVAGIDNRFEFAAPVYGCGFLADNSMWLGEFQKMGRDKTHKWVELWDPSVYLPSVLIPMLWVDGSNDFAYPMDSVQKSYRLTKGVKTLCIRLRMPHGHGGAGENPKEIDAMAGALFTDGVPLPKITNSGRDGVNVFVTFESSSHVSKVELNYTTDSGTWEKRSWQTIPATVDEKVRNAHAVLPKGTTVYYFNVIDERDIVVSSEHEETLVSPKNSGSSG
ncbi:MAG: acetylxylan esterase [Sedimentisphaerales bacterium]|nr:acetylxylan esterase [Sedimentisphaerales bacterium]